MAPRHRLYKRIVALIFVVVLAAGFVIPLWLPDGAQKYSGAEHAAAKAALHFAWARYSGIDTINDPFGLAFFVEKAVPAPKSEGDTFCNDDAEYLSNYNGPDRFEVTVNNRKPFGLLGKSQSYRICMLDTR